MTMLLSTLIVIVGCTICFLVARSNPLVGLLILAAIITLLLVGCSHDLNKGVVVGKDHQDAWIQIIPGTPPICSPSGTTVSCTAGTPAQTIAWPERWTLHLRDGSQTGDHDVSQSDYNKYSTGSNYP